MCRRIRDLGSQHLVHQRDQFAEGWGTLGLVEAFLAGPHSDEVVMTAARVSAGVVRPSTMRSMDSGRLTPRVGPLGSSASPVARSSARLEGRRVDLFVGRKCRKGVVTEWGGRVVVGVLFYAGKALI